MAMKQYQGNCHCKAVRYQASLDIARGTNRCNCSLCWKARAWFVIVSARDFKLLTSQEEMGEYRWIPQGKQTSHLTYRFCKHCGIRIFAYGEDESLGGEFYALHVPTLDISMDELAAAPLKLNDMLHNRPDLVPEDTRLL